MYLRTRVNLDDSGALAGCRKRASYRNLHASTNARKVRRKVAMILDAIHESCRTELAARESNGITVKLFWSRETAIVTVTVSDTANGDYFELVLDENERALDVFHHPYAHAAARGVEFRTRPRGCEVMVDG
jgi:hypothetical protein